MRYVNLFLAITLYISTQIQSSEIENWKELRQVFAEKQDKECSDFRKSLKEVFSSRLFIFYYCKYDDQKRGVPLVLKLRVRGEVREAEAWLMKNFEIPALTQKAESPYISTYKMISPYKLDLFETEGSLEIKMYLETMYDKENEISLKDKSRKNWKDLEYFTIEFAWYE